MAGMWRILVEPQGKNPGKRPGAEEEGNVGGMIVYVTNGATRQEVSRVAWVRRNSNNPKTSFKEQFKAEVDKARASVALLNEQFVGSGELA